MEKVFDKIFDSIFHKKSKPKKHTDNIEYCELTETNEHEEINYKDLVKKANMIYKGKDIETVNNIDKAVNIVIKIIDTNVEKVIIDAAERNEKIVECFTKLDLKDYPKIDKKKFLKIFHDRLKDRLENERKYGFPIKLNRIRIYDKKIFIHYKLYWKENFGLVSKLFI